MYNTDWYRTSSQKSAFLVMHKNADNTMYTRFDQILPEKFIVREKWKTNKLTSAPDLIYMQNTCTLNTNNNNHNNINSSNNNKEQNSWFVRHKWEYNTMNTLITNKTTEFRLWDVKCTSWNTERKTNKN